MNNKIDIVSKFTRVPQAITFDFDAISRKFGLDLGAIISDLVLFISRKKMENLFDEVSFTMEDFCIEYGYDRTVLQRSIKDLPLDPVLDGYCYDSLFEYAIYRAANEAVSFEKRAQKEVITRTMLLFNEVRISSENLSNPKAKRTYTIKFSMEINTVLFNSYHLADREDYRALKQRTTKKTGVYRRFYLQLIKFLAQVKFNQTQQRDEEYILSVDEILNIFDSSACLPKNKKKMVKYHLTKICDTIENTKFNWEFVKNGSRRDYFVRFTFPKESLNYFDEKLKASFLSRLLVGLQYQYSEKANIAMNNKNSLPNEELQKAIEWYFSTPKTKKEYDRFLILFKDVYGVSYRGEFGQFPVVEE